MSLIVNAVMDEPPKAGRFHVGEFSHAGAYPSVS